MRGWVLLGFLGLAAGAALVARRVSERISSEVVSVSSIKTPEAAPLCPWREPESDLKVFFPGATRYAVETRILSGMRLELSKQLGRTPTGDENALRVYRVYHYAELVGSVLTRRVKGEHGGIELILAVDTKEIVRGLRLQRLREPAAISSALDNPSWLDLLAGKRASDPWQFDADISPVSKEAQPSAQAILEGARSSLILLAAAERAPTATVTQTHHQ